MRPGQPRNETRWFLKTRPNATITRTMNDRLLHHIEALPPLPESAQKLQAAYSRVEVDVPEVVAILGTDPMLTANVLKAANSPYYGFASQITSIQHAITLLGPSVIRGLALADSIREHLPLDMSPYGLTNHAFAELASRQQALACRWFALEEPEELKVLMPASFIMDLGKLLVARAVTEDGRADEFQQDLADGKEPGALETTHVGCDSHTVSAAMFRRWRLEPDLVDAIEAMTNPGAVEEPVRSRAHVLAAVAASIGVHGVLTEAQLRRGRWLAAAGGRDPRVFDQAVDELRQSNEPSLTQH